MAIFPKLHLERVLQVDDKTRLDASGTFISGATETVLSVEIKPEASGSYVDVYNTNQSKWFLDWAYETDGIKTVEVKVTTDLGFKSKTYEIIVLSEDDDCLFSDDNDLYTIEPTIRKYLPSGKNSFKYVHREAQTLIISYLDEQRIWKIDNTIFTKEDIASITDLEFKKQFREWSKYQTLLLIFESLQVGNDDIFQEKKLDYEKQMLIHRNRSSLRLDKDKDGIVDEIPYNIRSARMVRR